MFAAVDIKIGDLITCMKDHTGRNLMCMFNINRSI
jgi:hypothetical protein